MKNNIILQVFLCMVCILMTGLLSCDPEVIGDHQIDDTEVIKGTVEVDFIIRHALLPSDRIVRTGLHFGESANHIYRGDYFLSANVTDSKRYYRFNLSPGTYYFEAIIACLCEGDSCSAGGFPGNQFGEKHTMGRFTVTKDETTVVVPDFNR